MLKMQKISKSFHKGTANEINLFQNFDLEVKEGEFVTVIGSNGAGKSTIQNIITGQLPIDQGKIIVDGKDVTYLPEYKRTSFISRVFQNPTLGTAPNMTIEENLSMAMNKGKTFGLSFGIFAKQREEMKELLAPLNLGLQDKLHVKVGMLSGGQRQVLSLLMATMKNPKILLLDEHTAALDPKTSERVIELTEEIVKKEKLTTIMVTHDMQHAIVQGTRLLMFHEGKIIVDIQGTEKKELTVEALLHSFEKIQSKNIYSDRMLLA